MVSLFLRAPVASVLQPRAELLPTTCDWQHVLSKYGRGRPCYRLWSGELFSLSQSCLQGHNILIGPCEGCILLTCVTIRLCP